jgi:MFS family permease
MLGRYATVATLVRAGDEASGPAVLLTVAALGGGTRRAALLMAALTAAAAVGGPLVGALLDRLPRIGYLGGLLLMAAGLCTLALGIGRLPLLVLIPAGLAGGLAQPMFSGGWTALLARLVPAGEFARASAMDAATYDVGGIAGPALAAASLTIDPRAPLLCCVLLIVAAFPVLLGFTVPPAAPRDTSFRADIAGGVRAVVRRPALRRITALSTMQHAGIAGRTIAAPLIAERLTGGPALAGVLLSVSAAASLAGSLLLTRRRLNLPPYTTAWLATAVTATTTAILAIHCPLWTVFVLFAAGGAVDAPLLTSVFAVRNTETPESLRGQVFATAASIKTSAYAGTTVLFGLVATSGAAACLLASAAIQAGGLLGYRPSASMAAGSLSRRNSRHRADSSDSPISPAARASTARQRRNP